MRQHFVPQSYLKAWCDPQTPPGHEPYIWLCDRRERAARKKSPTKVLAETDFYTIKRADGSRDLILEHGLSQLESRFAALRRNKLDRRLPLSDRDFVNLCAFVAAMAARTKSRGTHLRSQWQRVLDMAERVEKAMAESTPEDRAQMASALAPTNADDQRNALTVEDVRGIVDQPVQSFLIPEVGYVTPALTHMTWVIVETTHSPGFVTSDAPCIWFDPDLLKEQPPFGAGGLISPNIEISMPLSPRQLILFGHRLIASGRYVPLNPDDPLVAHFNRRLCHFADEYVVSSEDVTKEEWF